MTSIAWLVILAVLIVIEIATLGLTTIWFAAGALVAFLLSLVQGSVFLEVVIFLGISLLMLIFTRPVAVKFFNTKRIKTNYESVIGRVAKVTETINNFNSTGGVSVAGVEWTARAANDNNIIKPGTKVIIKEVSGVKLIVEPLGEQVAI